MLLHFCRGAGGGGGPLDCVMRDAPIESDAERRLLTKRV